MMMKEKRTSPGHREDILEVVSEIFATHPEVTTGKMFGYPAFYTDKKMFACVYGDGLSLKLPVETIRELENDPSVQPFQPYNGPKMKEWVLISYDDADLYKSMGALFEESISFVKSTSSKK